MFDPSWIDGRRRSGDRIRRLMDDQPSRKAEGECRTLSLLGLNGHDTAVIAGNVANNCQTQTGSTGFSGSGLVNAVEALEHSVEVGSGDPDAVIVNRHFDPPLVPTNTNLDQPAVVAVLDTVLDQVADR